MKSIRGVAKVSRMALLRQKCTFKQFEAIA